TSLAEAIRRGLGGLRLVVSSRAEPPLPLQRLRLRGELTELHADDLALNQAEAVALLGQYDLHLRPHQLQMLVGRTEGWAAGVRLAALSLAERDDLDAAVSELAGDHRNVADFFVEEVLDQLPRALVEFLVDTSVPRRVCADLANALTGRTDSQAVLDDLERRNLFLVALDDRRQWYRYHHLFADLLRHRLGAMDAPRERELNQVAASWYAQNGEPLEAARHLATAGTWGDLARYVIRIAGTRLLGVERHALIEVVERLPRELVLCDPEAATAAALAAFARYDAAGVRAHVALARNLGHDSGGPDAAATEAVLALLDAGAAWLEGDAEAQVSAATDALDQLTRLSPAAVPAAAAYRGEAGLLLGVGLMWCGRFDEADDRLTRTLHRLKAQDAVPPVLGVQLFGNLAVLRSLQGRLREAVGEAQAAESVAARSGWLFLPQSATAILAEAVVAMTRGDDEACAGALDRCRSALGDVEDRFAATALELVRVRLQLAGGRSGTASATLQELRRRTASGRLPWFLERWTELVELETALVTGSEEDRERLLRGLEKGWGQARPEAHRSALVARAHLEANRPETALRRLEPVVADEGSDVVPAIDAWVVRALAHDRLREDAEALAALDRALELAEPEGVVRPFAVSGERMRTLLERHQQVEAAHHDLVLRLVNLLRHRAGAQELAEVTLLEPLTNREQSVLQLLPTMMSNSEIADELFVSVNTVKVHLKSLYRKLGVGNRRQAVARARLLGLVGNERPTGTA
ncbi:MAG: LuxR C-terminal-related transcriptional regulator, partial [Nocardioidaceae bacterium]